MQTKPTILLAEADANIRGLMNDCLCMRDFNVTTAATAAAVLSSVLTHQSPMVCILSDNLSDMPIASLVQTLREGGFDMPILVFSDCTDKEQMLAVYQAGVDCYLHKPISMDILLLQVDALLRLYHVGKPQREDCFLLGDIYFDANSHRLGDATLSSLENELMIMLCRNRNNLVLASDIRRQLWLDRGVEGNHLLPVYIYHLRKYLEKVPAVAITSVHRQGYKLVDVVK